MNPTGKKMKEIENKLNQEYEHIGVISIKKLHEETVDLSEIEYVKAIMDKITPLQSQERVVLAKKYSWWEDKYQIVDGYHRIKAKISKRESTVKAIILDDYSIKRKTDTLFSFLQGLKEITFIENNLFVSDGDYYQIIENEGCGGCSNGWSSIKVFPEYMNKKIKIKKIESVDKDEYSDEYDLVINDEKIAKVDTGWGNGYYGGDFEVNIIR